MRVRRTKDNSRSKEASTVESVVSKLDIGNLRKDRRVAFCIHSTVARDFWTTASAIILNYISLSYGH